MVRPKAPNEKACEELFLMYAFMRVYRLRQKRMVIYAPTLKEEKESGYDAKANIGCHELYIQFKRAKYNKITNELYFDINQDQLKNPKLNIHFIPLFMSSVRLTMFNIYINIKNSPTSRNFSINILQSQHILLQTVQRS